MEITVLCKVVDNFGDIGVANRLVHDIKNKAPEDTVNLIVDDLGSYKKILNKINGNIPFQTVDGIQIYDWNAYDFCYGQFSKSNQKRLQIILELFQCGRPEWMEKILFDEALDHIVNIIMIDYLTAEPYAEEFHCLKSLTRSSKVQKVNFMPGFTDKTGGLVLGQGWEEKTAYKGDGPVLVFCYDREGDGWKPLAKALNGYCKEKNAPLEVCAAQGKGYDCFMKAFESCSDNPSLKVKTLPYLDQTQWDDFMKGCSVLFIRGEESLSRACLSGIPFVWHAYPQSEEYQLVKVKALLAVMKKFFTEKDFALIEKLWLYFNTAAGEVDSIDFENTIKEFLQKSGSLVTGFEAFSDSLRKNGNLTQKLISYAQDINGRVI